MPIAQKTPIVPGRRRMRRAAVAAGCVLAGMGARAAVSAPPAGIALPPDLKPLKEHCLAIADIRASRVASDDAVILFLKDGRVVVMRLKRRCPQLLFHGRFRFAGEMGQICAELDRIVTRAGLRCSIAGFALLPCPKGTANGSAPWCRPPFPDPDSQASFSPPESP